MFHLTKQEQIIVLFIMLALIIGAIIRIQKSSSDFRPISTTPSSTAEHN
jgi:hypothetical protein